MKKLSSVQAKYLRGLAHALKPIVIVGQKGLTAELIRSVDEAFEQHELIKVKFNEFKEKKLKKEIAAAIENKAGCRMAGMIGHIAILYRPHPDPEKRHIRPPD